MREHIQKRIAELTKERDAYVVEVNRQLAAHNGAINILEQMLEETAPSTDSGQAKPHENNGKVEAAELAEALKE